MYLNELRIFEYYLWQKTFTTCSQFPSIFKSVSERYSALHFFVSPILANVCSLAALKDACDATAFLKMYATPLPPV